MRKILDERERMQRRQHRRLIITETLMFLSVVLLVGFLTLVVMGYTFNIRGVVGEEEIVERTGLVQVSSVPTGATIYIDGETSLLFNTNASRAVLSGEHEISLARGGYDGWKKTINVTEGMMYRLNYPRLFKEEREKEEVVDFAKEVEFVTVSPNNEVMVVQLSGALYTVNMNENKPGLKALELLDAKGSAVRVEKVASASWSGNSERLMAKVNGEWVVMNVRDTKATVWLTEVKKIASVQFETEAGDRLLILNDKNELMEMSVRDGKLSEVLMENVAQFDNDGEKVVFLTKQAMSKDEASLVRGKDEVAKVDYEWQLRAWRVGEEESHLVMRFELEEGEELGEVNFGVMQYFQEFYVGIVRGEEFVVYKKVGWPMADEEMEKVFEEKLAFEAQGLKKRGRGMVFELAKSAEEAVVFDIEAMKTTMVNVAGSGWVDEYLRFRIEEGKLSVLDYDGLNERALVASGVVSGRVVAISGNGRWLYYFSGVMDGGGGESVEASETSESGEASESGKSSKVVEKLVRERIN